MKQSTLSQKEQEVLKQYFLKEIQKQLKPYTISHTNYFDGELTITNLEQIADCIKFEFEHSAATNRIYLCDTPNSQAVLNEQDLPEFVKCLNLDGKNMHDIIDETGYAFTIITQPAVEIEFPMLGGIGNLKSDYVHYKQSGCKYFACDDGENWSKDDNKRIVSEETRATLASKLRNYAYDVTPLDSMPYRLIEALTRYVAPNDLFHPTFGIYLDEPAFYALAKLAGRTIETSPRAFAIEEFTKAALLLHQREKEAKSSKTFPHRYFFVDLKYQDDFLNEYYKRFGEDDHQLLLQTTKQLQNMYNMSDEQLSQILTQNEADITLKSTDPRITNRLFSLSLPRTGSRDLSPLLRGAHNIHLIVTNKMITDGRISRWALKDIDNMFAIVELQLKYSFNGCDWVLPSGQIVPTETVAHMKGVDFDDLRLPDDEAVRERIYRNLINLHTIASYDDIWSKIVRDMLHQQLTLHHNLEIHKGSYMELLGGAGDLVQSPTIANALDNLAMQKAKAIDQQIDSLSRTA